jgi:hypothetical protein
MAKVGTGLKKFFDCRIWQVLTPYPERELVSTLDKQ